MQWSETARYVRCIVYKHRAFQEALLKTVRGDTAFVQVESSYILISCSVLDVLPMESPHDLHAGDLVLFR
jgi:hypothetical protein